MSSERRIIRPYVGVDRFQSILDKCELHIGGDILEPGEHRTVSSSSFLNDPSVLIFARDDDELPDVRKAAMAASEAVGLDPSEIEFVVIASSPYLRVADIAYRGVLSDDETIPRSLNVTAVGPRALHMPSGGCDIDIYFCLVNDRAPEPLKPSRQGTWLGRARFGLRTELGELGFTPRPLTAALRVELELPDAAIRYVDVDVDALFGDDLAGAVELYVDETLLGVLSRSANSPAARSFQRQIFIDVIAAVLRSFQAQNHYEDLQLAEIEDTVVGRIVWAAAGPGRRGESPNKLNSRREHALNWFVNKPEHFLALIEAASVPLDDWRHAIGGFE